MAASEDNTFDGLSEDEAVIEPQSMNGGLQPCMFEPRRAREQGDIDRDADNEESDAEDERSLEDLPAAAEDPQLAPRSKLDHLEWCICGRCDARTLGREKECLCCRKKRKSIAAAAPNPMNADDPPCVTYNEDLRLLCLNPVVLQNVLVQLNDVRGDAWANPANNRALRWAAYRQYTWYVHGKLGQGRRKVIPSCLVHLVRTVFPKAAGDEYEPYHSGPSDSDSD